MVLSKSDLDNPDHLELKERIRKTLYYGRTPSTERPSLPVTEIAVDFLQDAAPRELGRVDSYIASSVGKKACVSPCSMMLGMLYIERLKHRNPEYLRQVSSSDLFLVSMMVASKYLYDEGVEEEVFNDEWAESANMDVEDLNDLEQTFLTAIDWSLFVRAEEFWKILGNVEKRIATCKGLDRGFYTYTDLHVLTQDVRVLQAIQEVAYNMGKVFMVFSLAYVAGTLTLVCAPLALNMVKSDLSLVQESPIWRPFDAVHLDVGVSSDSLLPSVWKSYLPSKQASPDVQAPKLQRDDQISSQTQSQFQPFPEVNAAVGDDPDKIEKRQDSEALIHSRFSEITTLLPVVLLGETIAHCVALLKRNVPRFVYYSDGHGSAAPGQAEWKKMDVKCSSHCCNCEMNDDCQNSTTKDLTKWKNDLDDLSANEKFEGSCVSYQMKQCRVSCPSCCCLNMTDYGQVDSVNLGATLREIVAHADQIKPNPWPSVQTDRIKANTWLSFQTAAVPVSTAAAG